MEFRDLKAQYITLKKKIDDSINSILAKSNFILGSQVAELEEQLAEYVGVKYCITCANGTDALVLMLIEWGIGAGDAVFVPDFTYIATASAAAIRGATPVFVDIDKETFNMSPSSLEEKIQLTLKEGRLKPKVIVAVDLFGQPANYMHIEKIAQKYDLLLLEDGAQGFGGEICKKRACSFGHAATTSFFPAKPLGCYGDGGAVFTNDKKINVDLRSLRSHGRSPEDKYDNRVIGINSRLDTLQAAILLPKLEAFKEYELEAVNKVAKHYNHSLQDYVKTPFVEDGYLSSWAQYTIRLESKNIRDDLQQHLKINKIPSMIYYPRPLHKQSAFSNLTKQKDSFYNSEMMADTVLSLPIHPYMNEEDIEEVCDTIKLYFKNNK